VASTGIRCVDFLAKVSTAMRTMRAFVALNVAFVAMSALR